jgi:uroporphyrinogen decarboxylase
MTSRERVLAAISHKQTDRVPVNYLGTPEVNARMREYFLLGDPRDGRPGDMVLNDWDILARLGADLRTLRLRYQGPPLPVFDDGSVRNYWGVIRRPVKTPAGVVMESLEHPWATFQTLADMESYAWPDPSWFDYGGLPEQCEAFGDFAVVYGWPGNMDLINGTAFARGFEQTIMDLASEDPVGMACLEKRFEFHHEQSRRALEACGGRIDILWAGDDFGTQRGLLLSPARWRKIFAPKIRAMADLAHHYGARLMLHSCGSTRRIWPNLIDAGVDIYDTVQPEAAGMDPRELAAEFGARIVLHGTISTQHTLPFGTPGDVTREVQARLDIFAEKGGLILAPSHNIQPDTPVENVLAMYRAAGSLA